MLYYTISGARSDNPLLFLHAGNYSGTMWHDIAARVSNHHCIFVDLPGHGYSREIDLTSLDQAADAVARVIEQDFGGGPVNLVGLSFGGYVGLILMARHPHLIRRSMLSGIHLGAIPNAKAMNLVAGLMSPLIRLGWVRRKLAEPLGITDASIIDRTDGRANLTPRTMRAVLRLVSVFDVQDELPSIEVPTLMIAGGNEHATIIDSLRTFQAAMPACTARTVPGMGHAWCNEDPQLFAQTLQMWCDGSALSDRLNAV
ncbi:alpha/beta fold hydrolase [Roseobacter weihaiensis]|uniref:alpha/beta fold hydrolase n=1 Tax=Roseobacter weihaiensis TaxID=2763262 RepID=UPI001D0B92A7|nr:alpha/beta hydrolase [Roseobacter sp. H9]